MTKVYRIKNCRQKLVDKHGPNILDDITAQIHSRHGYSTAYHIQYLGDKIDFAEEDHPFDPQTKIPILALPAFLLHEEYYTYAEGVSFARFYYVPKQIRFLVSDILPAKFKIIPASNEINFAPKNDLPNEGMLVLKDGDEQD